MITKLNEKLNPAQYAKFIPTQMVLQNLFNEMTADRKKMLSDIYNYEHDEVSDKSKVLDWEKDLADAQAELPGVQSAIANITDPVIRKAYEAKAYNLDEKIERAQRNLRKKNTSSIFKNTMAYSYHHEAIIAMDEWADSVGRWFEEGALGEGEVTYNDKTYTYKES